jgi:hypothetical protein
VFGNFFKRGDCAFVAFDSDDAACAKRKQGARKPPGPVDLYYNIFKRFSRSRYARGQIEVENFGRSFSASCAGG